MTLPSKPPQWEGLYSFNRVWADLLEQADELPVDDSGFRSGAAVVAIQALAGLAGCHPICIGTEQILALPPVEGDVREVIRNAPLPFPTIYLDFSSVRGAPRLRIVLKDGDMFDVAMYGALVAAGRSSLPAGSVAGHGRTVIPLGTGVAFVKASMAGLEFADPEAIRHPARPDGRAVPAAGTMGSYVTDTDEAMTTGQELVRGAIELEGWRERPIRTAFVHTPYARTDLLGQPLRELLPTPVWGRDPGSFFGGTGGLVANGLLARADGDALASFHEQATLEAVLTYGMAEYVARALYLLSAINVDLVDAPLSRQVRRQTERKGTGIAKIVTVRRTQVRRYRTPPSGRKRNYTHRFERRATYRHVTRGPHYLADLVKPCTRRDEATGELTCPNGCRLEYVPQHWVGDESLPMVPKTRRLSIQRPSNREDPA